MSRDAHRAADDVIGSRVVFDPHLVHHRRDHVPAALRRRRRIHRRVASEEAPLVRLLQGLPQDDVADPTVRAETPEP